ncbi:MAG: tRNA lysidine(34) synthetase TilS [Micropruina sp.]|nr:tRNA lysidine(34) synthetase TilS [Micropruina sp.]
MARRALQPASFELVAAVEQAWRGEEVLVACSGGSDSLALAACAAIAGQRRGFGVRAVTVDHGLQPDSSRWAEIVAERLAGAGIAPIVLAVTVRDQGQGLEAAAREARYAALSAEVEDGEAVYLGHTLDDQAETVLLGLARGSGGRSLSGMPAVRAPFVRPFLGVRSAITTQACRELGLQWIDDPHNAQARFTRVRVRERVLPLLEAELGPGVVQALARTAELLRADADLLDHLAQAELDGLGQASELDCTWLAGLPRPLLSRVLRLWLFDRGATEVPYGRVRAVEALVIDWHGQAWIELAGLRVIRRNGRLSAGPA